MLKFNMCCMYVVITEVGYHDAIVSVSHRCLHVSASLAQ